MENEFILSIGIPTYNGSKYLSNAIRSILKELPKDKYNNFEILIFDNASTDETRQIVTQFQKQYPQLINYYCHKDNLGFDKNLDLLIRNAKGRYIKLLGDDDELMPNSVNRIIEALKQNTALKAIVHSVEFIDSSTEKVIKSDHKIQETSIYRDGDEFFQKTKWTSAALSSLVIHTDTWKNCSTYRYYGTQWIHIGGLIELLKGNKHSMGIKEQLCRVRLNNNRWHVINGNQLKLGIKHLRVLKELLRNDYKKETYKVFLNDRWSHNFSDIEQLRPKVLKENLIILFLMSRLFWRYPKFWIRDAPMLIIGQRYLSFGRKIKRILGNN
jgi:abequosyltransferase